MWELAYVKLPDGQRVCIQMQDGRIVGITDEPQCTGYVDGNGYLALPGLIDGHVHDRTSGYEEFDEPEVETVETLVSAALAGGVTTVVAMPNPRKPTTTIEALERKIARVGRQPITYDFYFGATTENAGEIRQLRRYRSRVRKVKLYMAETTGGIVVPEDSQQLSVCETCADAGIPIGVHPEDQQLMDRNRKRYGARPLILSDHCVLRDTEVEVSAIRRALSHQRDTGGIVHFCHVSTPEGIELINDARERGARVTLEVCPHHTELSDQFLLRPDGVRGKVNPPLRKPSQVRQVREYVNRPGMVDMVATDHAPHRKKSMSLETPYDKVPSGMTGVQTMFPLMFSRVAGGEMTLAQFIELTSVGPARVFGYENKGRIAVGADADIVIVDPDAEVELRDEDMRSRCGWTPYHGMRCTGAIVGVVAKGRLLNAKLSV